MQALERMTARLNRQAAYALEQARRIEGSIATTRLMLERATDEFLRTGTALVTADLSELLSRHIGEAADSYFRALAKEIGRPPLIAVERTTYSRGKYISFSMPKIKRLRPAIAGMLLLAVENGDLDHAVTSENSPGMWRLNFNGPAGRDHFDAFRERCATDPVMRITLGLNR